MLNYYSMEIEHKKDYNPRELSAQISCQNMGVLAKEHLDRQNEVFSSHINYDDCVKYHNFQPEIDDIKRMEIGLLRGFNINKKSCIYKRPLYTSGEWSNQFESQLQDMEHLFEYQTKAKTKDDFNCDYSALKIPDNFYDNISCDKGKHFLYTKTFRNDYYSCLI